MLASFFKKYAVVIAFIMSAVLVVYASLTQSIWLDEGLTMQFASESVGENIYRSMTTDLHPPLYYLFLKVFSVLGEPKILILIYRAVSLAWFLLAAYCLYRYARGWKDGTGRVAAVLFLFSPFALHYASEIRSVMFVICLSMIQFAAFDTLCAGNREKKWIVAYVASSIIGLYAFYPIGFLLVAEYAYIAWFKRTLLKQFFLMGSTMVLAYLPWMFAALIQRIGETPGHFLSIPWWQIPAVMFLGFSGGRVPITDVNHIHAYWPTALIGIGAALNFAGLWFVLRNRMASATESIRRILFVFLVVVALCLGISIFAMSIFDPRYYAQIFPLFILLSATAFVSWRVYAPRFARVVLLSLIISYVAAIALYLFNPLYGREHWAEVVLQVEAELMPGDAVVFIGRSVPPPPYTVYQTKETDLVGTYPDDLNNTDDYARIEAHLSSQLADNPRIWYSQFLAWQKDPEGRIRSIIEQEYEYKKTVGFFKVMFDLYEQK